MKITKFVHACLLVEAPEAGGRVALFDPGVMSEAALNEYTFTKLDDIFVTHDHADHISMPLIKKLVEQFPDVRITTTPEIVAKLAEEGITATAEPTDGISFFDSPHEDVEPLFPVPQEIGVHFLDALSHPGDSHSFHETKAILALPMTAPWGATIRAYKVASELKPRYVIPIHDWHWRDEAREQIYGGFEQAFKAEGITFFKMETGQPVEIDLS